MTNNSNQHVKVTKNQTLGMLKSCDSDQICTIHRLVTFEPKSLEGEGIKLDHTKSSQTINSIKTQPTINNCHDVQSDTVEFESYIPSHSVTMSPNRFFMFKVENDLLLYFLPFQNL